MKKLKINMFFRCILCLILLMFGAVVVRFSSTVSFANNIDIGPSIEAKEKKDDNIVEFDNELYEKYVLASSDNLNDYPQDWIKLFNYKMIELQDIFPSGMYWNHMGKDQTNPEETNNIYSVTDIPCNHYQNGEIYCNAHYGKSDELYPYKSTCSQCRGFASLLSDIVFGPDAPVRYFENYDELRIGDQARIDNDYHTVFIVDKTDEYVIVAECNSDLETCKICWGRKILRENMDGWYISRWEKEDSSDFDCEKQKNILEEGLDENR